LQNVLVAKLLARRERRKRLINTGHERSVLKPF
jgi:hypothetical protein